MAEKGIEVLPQPVYRMIDPVAGLPYHQDHVRTAGLMVLDQIIIIVAVMTNLTAIQRIVWVYQHGKGVPLE
jgi:hypothetical protein